MSKNYVCFAVLALTTALGACTTSQRSSSLEELPGAGYSAPNFGDTDPANIKGRKPNTYQIHGVDVSRYNGNIGWRAAKKGGIEFAFIKATEGKDNVDPNFKRNWREAASAGVQRSAYHFYYFCASPEAQAKNYIANVPKSHSSLPPVLDVEWNSESPTCTTRPPRKVVVEQLGRFLKILQNHYRQRPIIYTTVDFHRDNLSGGALRNYTYWLRSVTAQPHFKYSNRSWQFWQYTGTGLAPGFRNVVDINVFKGNRQQWKNWVAANTR